MIVRGPAPVLTVLGAGTCVPNRARHSAAYHVDLGSTGILLDCGPGTLHGFDAYGVPWANLSHIAVSHYHVDHVGDLAAVLFALEHGSRPRRSDPLTLIGPVGFHDFLRRLADALGDHVLRPAFEVKVSEIESGRAFEDSFGRFRLECRHTPHTGESLAYRLTWAGGALGYTGDTGPSGDLGDFLSGCDVLLAECSLADPPETDLHLSPARLAEIARRAAPELLVVAHVYPFQTPDEAAARVAERYEGAVLAAADGMRISLRPGGPTIDPPATRV